MTDAINLTTPQLGFVHCRVAHLGREQVFMMLEGGIAEQLGNDYSESGFSSDSADRVSLHGSLLEPSESRAFFASIDSPPDR